MPTEAGPVTGSLTVSLVGDPATVLADQLAEQLAEGCGVSREQVSAAMSRLASARASAAHVQAFADDAQARLEAARGLAAEAGIAPRHRPVGP